MYTKHGLNRMLERVVLKQTKRFNKKQRKRYKKRANQKFQKDMKNMFAYYNCSNGKKIIYTDLQQDKSCTKYILSETKKIITVIKVNFQEEKKDKPLIYYKSLKNQRRSVWIQQIKNYL